MSSSGSQRREVGARRVAGTITTTELPGRLKRHWYTRGHGLPASDVSSGASKASPETVKMVVFAERVREERDVFADKGMHREVAVVWVAAVGTRGQGLTVMGNGVYGVHTALFVAEMESAYGYIVVDVKLMVAVGLSVRWVRRSKRAQLMRVSSINVAARSTTARPLGTQPTNNGHTYGVAPEFKQVRVLEEGVPMNPAAVSQEGVRVHDKPILQVGVLEKRYPRWIGDGHILKGDGIALPDPVAMMPEPRPVGVRKVLPMVLAVAPRVRKLVVPGKYME